jgi:REP element-mobilizing transposase RayT
MSQSLAKIYIHAIFSTKNRERTLANTWQEELHKVVGGAINGLGCQSLVVGGVEDHLHCLVVLGRTLSISEAMRKIKSTSSLWINQNCGLANPFHWQAGYGAFSVSQSNVEAVREYIQRQREHHKTQSFQDEFREWLRRYEIEWDERYVWD